ncbi:hypothetical protein ACIA5D_07385 [Actinoplanes sp. NPDC051513]|uniref:hypothetical protein n=1 Tax=Actinoplanes sp. NPDC051513 TaxID=3363908 RepID=UPI0037B41977
MGILSLLARLINLIVENFSRNSLRELDRLQILYRGMTDEQLRVEFRRQVTAGRLSSGRDVPGPRFLMKQRDTSGLHALAIASCMFDRYPCDLPAGSRIYDEQRLAALMLLDQLNVQMDTGEGKTYAIAVGAAALLARYPQVVIITANAYLARRDRKRVSTFFEAMGIACSGDLPDAGFDGVAYATLEDLCFGYLQRTYFEDRRTYPTRAAFVVDEIDSVLLDQNLRHSLVRHMRSQDTMWEDIVTLVADWGPDQYTYNPVLDTITLGGEAWEQLARLGHALGRPAALLMDLAAGVLWAMRAKHGSDYIVVGREIRLINRVTGQPFSTASPDSAALEYLILGGNPRLALTLAEINALSLLSRHPHVVGLSGTVREDTLYYLQQLGTLTGNVPPRFPRFQTEIRTLLSPSREKTLEHILMRIEEESPRPVVIGTWSAAECRAVADWLRLAESIDPARVSTVASFDSATDAEIIENAGAPGAITVLSQGGSRGVDVRSAHRPLLIVIGRAVEPRLDRQFLGRVGRHGEAFDAEFVVDSQCPIWNPQLGFAARFFTEAMPLNRTAARGLRSGQRETWLGQVSKRTNASVLSRAVGQAEMETAARFLTLRRIGSPVEFSSHADELAAEHSGTPALGGGDGRAGLGTGDGRPALTNGGGPPSMMNGQVALGPSLVRALERRRTTDDVVRDFEAAVRAATTADGADGRPEYKLENMFLGDDAELQALTRWLRRGAEGFGDRPDTPAAALFRRQAALAAQQHLPIETVAGWRDPTRIERETRLMVNAAYLTQVTHKLESLWVSSTPATYYRRGAFAVRTLHELADLKARTEVLNNLLMADTPTALGELFFSAEHNIPGATTDEPEDVATVPAPAPPPGAQLADEQVQALVEEFLTERSKAPGGLPLPPDYARLLLLDVLRPLLARPGTVGGNVMRRQVDLMIDALATKGMSSSELRAHRRLIAEFVDSLHAKGVLSERLPAEGRLTGAARRVRTFVSTIPMYGVAAVLAYLAVAALGLLPTATPARNFTLVDRAADIFGFATVLSDRPLMAYFALIVVTQLAARAVGIADPSPLITRLAPLGALVFAFVVYGHGFDNLGTTLLLWLLLLLWTSPLLLVHRFVMVFVGADLTVVLAGISVAIFAVHAVVEGTATTNAMILVGLVAALAGPAVPVSVENREYVAGSVRHSDERTRTRVAIDPADLSGTTAFVVIALIGLSGGFALGGFVVLQLLAVLVIVNRRLSVDRIEGMMGKLRVGSPLTHEQLRGHLLRTQIRTVAVAAVILGLALWPVVAAGGASTVTLLLDQWAGVVLATGFLACGNAFSVGGRVALLRDTGEDDSGARPFRSLIQSWKRTRLNWVWRVAVIVIVLIRPLEWLAEATDLIDAAKAVWGFVTGIFT